MDPARRPTSANVAQRAGVSRATVSYVLNDVPHQSISDATRQRVLAAAEELGYTPHAAARTLRAGESRLVLFINAGIPYGANLSVIIDTLSAEVTASGRSLVIWQQHDPADLAATLAHLQPAMAITLGHLRGVSQARSDRDHARRRRPAAHRRAGARGQSAVQRLSRSGAAGGIRFGRRPKRQRPRRRRPLPRLPERRAAPQQCRLRRARNRAFPWARRADEQAARLRGSRA